VSGVARRAHVGAAAVLVACGAVAGLAPGSALADTEKAGDVLRFALPAAALAVTLRREDREGRKQLYRSFAVNVGATLLLKAVVDDERPDGSDDDAFPSGHTSMAFQGAAFLHRRYGARKAWPAYVAAAFVGWTRLDSDEHDETDVLAGAALGTATAFLLADRAERAEVGITPAIERGGLVLHFTGRF